MNNNQENILSTSEQGADYCGDVPFIDESLQVTTGNEIIAFSTVESPTVSTVPEPMEIAQNVLSNLHEGRDHSILDVISREYAFDDITIDPGGSEGDILATWDPLAILEAQDNVFDKISGFAFLRSSAVIRLEFTTVPTVTGGVILSYYPDVSPFSFATRSVRRIQHSQVPNVQQSLTTAVSMKIKVPFISPFYGRDLVNGFGSIGTVVFARLTPSSTAKVNVKAYISFHKEDLSLQYPTIEDPVVRVRRLKDRFSKIYIELEKAGELPVKQSQKVTLQAKQNTKTTNSSPSVEPESQKVQEGGKISGLLKTASNIATVASKIPVIGSAASVLAPLLSVGSTIAGLFGFSKPHSSAALTAVKWKPSDSMLASEGTLQSHVFTINEGCGVIADYGPFGSKVDEMAIEAIFRVPNIFAGFEISTSFPTRYVLHQSTLTLAKLTDVSGNAFIPTHQMWISQLFHLWNATLNFDFDVYLTHFHRVKLRFAVLPNVYLNNMTGTVLPTSYDLNKASCAVVEFTGDNVNYSIQIEPRSNTSMKYTPSAFQVATDLPTYAQFSVSRNTVDCSYGTLLVLVEVPLEVSSTTSPTIHAVVSFSAENVELSHPVTAVPMVNVTGLFDGDIPPTVTVGSDLPVKQSQKSTLGTEYAKLARSERMVRGADLLQSNSVPIDDIANLKASAGDRCLHLRNLLNGFERFASGLVTVPTSYVLRLNYMLRRSGVTLDPSAGFDLVDYLQIGYAFYKGSMNGRIAIHTVTSPLGEAPIAFEMAMTSGHQRESTVTPFITVVPGVEMSVSPLTFESGTRTIPVATNEVVTDFSIPYYQQQHINRPYPETGNTYGNPSYNYVELRASSDLSLSLHRAVGDDFRMGFLYALPRMTFRPKALRT